MIDSSFVPYLVILGVCIGCIAGSKYVYEMIKGRVKPNKITWLIWGMAPIIGGWAMLSNGFTWNAIPVISAGVWPLIIFILASFMPQAYWELKTFDYVCGVFSILAIILWQITDIALWAVILTVLADLLAGLPTIIKTWKFPETENFWPFLTPIFSNGVVLLAMNQWDLLEGLFPLYLLIFCIVMVALCLRQPEKGFGNY